MKVGFDISQIAHKGGVSVYTQELAKRLSCYKNLETVFFYSSLRKPYPGNLKNVKSYPIPPTIFEMLFNRLRFFPIEYFVGNIDVFHSSDWVQPPSEARKVTTYHDVVPLKYPQWSHPKIVEVHKRRLEIVEKEIDMVIAVSESAKKDLLEVSKIPEEKITVVYEAAGQQFKPQSEQAVEEFRRKMGLPDKFVLAIGGIGERRNISRIKEATGNYNLVVTGETIPNIADQEMPLLYSSAQVLVYPSLYEGFGLPILEAMACGIPVITSNVSSMPEVGGDAALYVDPFSTSQMAKAVDAAVRDKKLREELIQNGFKQAKEFSWEKCTEKTVEIYQKLMVSKK